MDCVRFPKPKCHFDVFRNPGRRELHSTSPCNSRSATYQPSVWRLAPRALYRFYGRVSTDYSVDRVSCWGAARSLFVLMKRHSEITKRYRAIFLVNGSIRKITFEALSMEEASRLAANWGFGLEGEEAEAPSSLLVSSPAKEAFDVTNACQVLGDISRTTLYRLLITGKLERLPATRKVLVTRRSIERFCSMAA
jgi:hypothetical protein